MEVPKEEGERLKAILRENQRRTHADDGFDFVIDQIKGSLTAEQLEDFSNDILKNFFRGRHVQQCYYQAIYDAFLRSQGRSQSPNDFYGRDEEIKELDRLFANTNYRLINLYGSHGIGKSSLVSEFTRRLVESKKIRKENCHWIDFDCRKSIEDLLTNLISKLFKQETLFEPASFSEENLFNLLAEERQLIVLKYNFIRGESIDISEKYIDLLHRISRQHSDKSHKSCILLITYFKIPAASELVSNGYATTLNLYGVDEEAGLDILEEVFSKQGAMLDRSSAETKRIVELLKGHPLILRLVASEILRDDPTGNIARFLERSGDSIVNLSDSIDKIYQMQIDGLDKYCTTILKLLLEESMSDSELELAFKKCEPSSKKYRKSIKTLENRSLLIKSGCIFSIAEIDKQFIREHFEDSHGSA
jgi:Cdc6-like AAA superfamily ATPase